MADPTDSSLAFFTKGTPKQWAFIYELRDKVIRLKADQRSSKKGPEEFIKLDNWYREKLPKSIAARKDAHLVYEELVQVAKWRLMMGKYRPKLLDLIRINTELSVTSITRKAFKKISAAKNLQQAITMLVNLKGIGPSTASAILSAAFPEEAPFMSDEGMLSTPGVEATDSTIAEYMNYSDQLRNKTQWLQSFDPEFKWTIHKVDQVLWIYYLARDHKPELLEMMPREDDLVCSTSTIVTTSNAPSSDAIDDNANDCSNSSSNSSSNEAEVAITNGHVNSSSDNNNNKNNNNNNNNHHLLLNDESNSESVPFSEEDYSQGGEASCSSSVAAAVANSTTSSVVHNGNGSSNASMLAHLGDEDESLQSTSPIITTTTTSSVNSSLSSGDIVSATVLAPVTTTNGSKRSLPIGEEDSSSANGLVDSEDSRDGARCTNLMMMTPSEENSIDGVVVDDPPMKKQKTLELATALAAATAGAVVEE
ncbi:hypothetical protein RDWZM_005276 [Blomia tropicalis]|uniref:Uncharacterized protein n=1 Tax=Blomia tropicalis TaxID=40697 RepID=A0A9Q0M5Z3_BLOTA|nr:hypothetical protein RDWZM_005276 [Blomia tropicalis]